MKILRLLPNRKKLTYFTWFISLAYVLIFILYGSKVGPAIAVFASIPVLLIGWTYGLRVGLAAGLLLFPINTILFNLVGFPGWDVVFRVGGGPGTIMLAFLGGAAGWVHALNKQLGQQVSAYQSAKEALQKSEEEYRNLYEGSLIDIHKREMAETLLRESEAKYRELLDNLPQKVFYKNTDLIYIKVNPGYARDLNRTPEDIAGKTDYDLYPPALANKYRTDDREVMSSGISIEVEEDYFQNGDLRTVQTVKVPVRDQQGNITGILGIFWDVTERKREEILREALLAENRRQKENLETELSVRKRVEAELRESEQRYWGLFEESPVSLWEEDFSEVNDYVKSLLQTGVTDLPEYLDEHPEVIENCLSRVKVIDVNREALHMYQAETKADLLNNFNKIFPLESFSIIREEMLAIARGQLMFESEGRNCTLTGEVIDIYLRWSVAPGCEDSLSRVFVSIMDISQRKKVEERAQEQAAQAEALTVVGNALTAASLDADEIYETITMHTATLIGDACLLTLLSEDQARMGVAAFYHVDSGKIPLMAEVMPQTPIKLADGFSSQVVTTGKPLIIPTLWKDGADQVKEPIYLNYVDHFEVESLLIVPIVAQGLAIGTLGVLRDRPGTPYTLEDLSLLRYLANQASLPILNARLHDRIKQQAHTDPLTNVPNRRFFFDLAELEFQKAEQEGHDLVVIMLDIDHFKEINDSFGHNVGDQMLQLVAEQCRKSIRSKDLIGRYGGDEFLVLLPKTDLPMAFTVAETLRKSIAEISAGYADHSARVTISLGIAKKSQRTPDLTSLLRLADEAMYVAKREGRNQIQTGGSDLELLTAS
jgi:diguanylate cyclase (GGDEF)-like protein/PAS domain S-box-containing protein